jgi:ABC-type transport system substrate-binding protein
MTVVSATLTQFLKYPIPGEDSDPFYDQFVALMQQVENWSYMNTLARNFFLAGGGTLTWDGVNGILTWTDDFVLPIFFWGKRLLLRYGPDNASRNAQMQNGQAMVVEIPFTVGTDTVVNFTVVSQLDTNKTNQYVIGWRNDSQFFLRGIGEVV